MNKKEKKEKETFRIVRNVFLAVAENEFSPKTGEYLCFLSGQAMTYTEV